MKKIITSLLLSAIIFSFTYAQQKTPTILKGPADWGFERMDFPLGFASNIDFKGFEEIRFAPNWMDTTSVNYFTYAFVMSIEGQKSFGKSDIKTLLDKYYKGLCIAIGQPKKLNPDTSKVTADVTEIAADAGNTPSFTATIPYFDTFSNGRKITLYLELSYVVKSDLNKTYLTILVSSSAKEKTDIWNKLREVKKNATY